MAKSPRFLAFKNAAQGKKLGEAVARISKAAGSGKSSPADSKELTKFVSDPEGWLDNYVKIEDGTPKGKKLKGNLKIVPVFDSEDVMFIKVPWSGALGNLNGPGPNQNYPTYKEFLASYFIRKCR